MSDSSEEASPAAIFIFALMLMALGGYFLISQATALQTYEPTNATVLSSNVEEKEVDDKPKPDYRPNITYEYVVDGQRYVSSNVMPGQGTKSERDDFADSPDAWARDIVERHPEGANVTAYYDPDEPSRSYLVRERSWLPVVALVVGGFAFLLGVKELVQR